DDQVDPRGRLEGADVPTLTTDDAALHVLRRKREDRDRRLGGLLRRDPLDRDRDDLAGALLALLPRPLLDLAHRGHRLALGVVDDLAHERLLGLLRGHPRDGLELRPMLLRRLLELLADALELLVPVVELLRAPLDLRELALEVLLPLTDPLLLPLDLLAPCADLLLRVSAHAPDLLLDLDEGLADDLLRLLLGVEHDPLRPCLGALGLGLGNGRPHQEADDDSRRRRDDGCDRYVHLSGSSKRKCRTEARSGHCSAVSARV